MTHATTWNSQTTGEAASPRGSAVRVGPASLGSRPSGRGRREFGLPLGAGVPTERDAGPEPPADPGTAPATLPWGETATREAVGPRRAPRRVRDGSLDAAAGDRTDSPGVRRALSPRACLEGADCVGLELPEARASGRRARRGGHRALEAGGLAAVKKTPLDVGPISCSSMRAGFCSSRMGAGPGRPRARGRASRTATATTVCRSAVAWRCRPRDGEWHSTSGVGPIISPALLSRPSSVTSCVTSADRSTGSGTAAQSIAGSRSPRSSPLTPTPWARLPRVRAGTQSRGVRVGVG